MRIPRLFYFCGLVQNHPRILAHFVGAAAFLCVSFNRDIVVVAYAAFRSLRRCMLSNVEEHVVVRPKCLFGHFLGKVALWNSCMAGGKQIAPF